MNLTSFVKPGDRVTILTPHHQERSGRAVILNFAQRCVVLNGGGRHGTPIIADADNVVRVKRHGRLIYGT